MVARMISMVIAAVLAGVAVAQNNSASGTSLVTNSVGQLSPSAGYHLFYRSGDKIASSQYPTATLTNAVGDALYASVESCTSVSCINFGDVTVGVAGTFNKEKYEISYNPDFSSIHIRNGSVLVLTQYEAPVPAAFYVTVMNQDAQTGRLTPVATYPTDWSAPELQGLWVPCAGSYLPWDSHAGGEEYEPDAYCLELAQNAVDLFNKADPNSLTNCTGGQEGHIVNMMRFWGYSKANLTADVLQEYFDPYKYGHAFEVNPLDNKGNVQITKWLPLGRHSYELWYVMPDNKTVYATDDGTNTAFWKFVADKPNDMSAGTLYGAKVTQLFAGNGGDFDVEWIELGYGTQEDLQGLLNSNMTFSKIFDIAPYNNGCQPGYTAISKRDNGRGATCLRLKPGMEQAAAFFESRRYLAYLNGTVEFSKMEGFTFDPVRMRAYVVMSVVRQGMEDNKNKGKNDTSYDLGGPNDIRLPYNPCGCVWYADVDSNYDIYHMGGEICGYPVNLNGKEVCSELGISEPDNVAIIPGQDTLIIAEDTNERQIDSMWQYDLATGELRRIGLSPYGAEWTNPYWFPNVNGWAYLTGAIQHPYGEGDQDKVLLNDNTGPAGYVGAWVFKADDFKNGARLMFESIPYPWGNDTSKQTVTVSASAYKDLFPGIPFVEISGSQAQVLQSLPNVQGGAPTNPPQQITSFDDQVAISTAG